MIRLSRRTALAAAGAALLARPARASPESVRAWLAERVRAEARTGRVRLTLPDFADNGAAVPLVVAVDAQAGAVRAIHLAADGNPNPGIASFRLGPGIGRPEIATRIRLARSQRVTAVAEFADGSAWSATAEVKVTLGGCGVGEPEAIAEGAAPRVRVPSPVRRGEVVEVRTLAPHAMESGERLDAAGARVRRRILNAFVCRYEGREVFAAAFEPAIAANPYLAFFVAIDAAGAFEFEWRDDDGSVLHARQAVALA